MSLSFWLKSGILVRVIILQCVFTQAHYPRVLSFLVYLLTILTFLPTFCPLFYILHNRDARFVLFFLELRRSVVERIPTGPFLFFFIQLGGAWSSRQAEIWDSGYQCDNRAQLIYPCMGDQKQTIHTCTIVNWSCFGLSVTCLCDQL